MDLSAASKRSKDGTLIPFDVPGAGTGPSQGTFPASINGRGEITGGYADANNAGHGFIKASDGIFTTFDAPGAKATFPSSINDDSEITGAYTDANRVVHGFLRFNESE